MFDNLKNIGSVIKQAGEMKERMAEIQAELKSKTVEGEAGGGAVRVVMNGQGRVVSVSLDDNLIAGIVGDDKDMVEDLIAAAVNNGMDRVQELLSSEVGRLTGGMDLPFLK